MDGSGTNIKQIKAEVQSNQAFTGLPAGKMNKGK